MAKEKERQSGAITREELTQMLDKYNIGKKPLSKLLGWGETTILLYLREEGELPDNEYTRRLKNLFENPKGFLALLNSAQGRISDIARRRSLDAIRALYPRTAVFEAAEYVINLHDVDSIGMEGETMSTLRLETILFWSQVISLCLYSEPLFEDDYVPGRTGLPYRAVTERMAGSGCIVPECLYDSPDEFAVVLKDEHKEILEFVTRMFDWYGTAALTELLEAEHFRLCGPKGARKRRTASKEMLRKCYGEVFMQAKVKKLKDVEGYMQKRMSYLRTHKEHKAEQ